MSDRLDEAEALSLKLFVVLSKAYKSVMEQAIQDMKAHGMSASEFMTLEVLYAKGRMPLQQIGEKILVTSGSITYNVDKLEKKGLLRRLRFEEDRRVIFAELTEEGEALFNRIFPEHTATIHELMSVLKTEEQQALIEMLKKIGKGADER